MRITWQNLDTAEYTPAPGIEYEIAPGVVRTLRRPAYDVMRAFMAELNRELPKGEDGEPAIGESDHEDVRRMNCMEIATEGDPIPEGFAGVDLTIATRAVGDFFTFRIPRPAKPPKS